MRIVLLMLLSVALAACQGGSSKDTGGGGGNAEEGRVYIACVEATHDDDYQCDDQPSSVIVARVLTESSEPESVLYRGQHAIVSGVVENDTPHFWSGYYRIEFDAPCDPGEPPWALVPHQYVEIPAGGEFRLGVGGACGAMPAGFRSLTFTLFDADSSTLRDEIVFEFLLIEEEE